MEIQNEIVILRFLNRIFIRKLFRHPGFTQIMLTTLLKPCLNFLELNKETTIVFDQFGRPTFTS